MCVDASRKGGCLIRIHDGMARRRDANLIPLSSETARGGGHPEGRIDG
jgi:hypothetical protein